MLKPTNHKKILFISPKLKNHSVDCGLSCNSSIFPPRLCPRPFCSRNLSGVPQAHFQVGRIDKSKSVAISLIKCRNMSWMFERENKYKTWGSVFCQGQGRNRERYVLIYFFQMFIKHDLFLISWKSDLNTSLAALELLSGLARIPIPEQGEYNWCIIRW